MDRFLGASREGDAEAVDRLIRQREVRLTPFNPVEDRAEIARFFSGCTMDNVAGTFPYNDGAGQVVRLPLDCIDYDFHYTLRDRSGADVPQPIPQGIDFWFDGERFTIRTVSIVTDDAVLE